MTCHDELDYRTQLDLVESYIAAAEGRQRRLRQRMAAASSPEEAAALQALARLFQERLDLATAHWQRLLERAVAAADAPQRTGRGQRLGEETAAAEEACPGLPPGPQGSA